jgi:two-component system cell cycle sensor histidine kinase/response regulator CckA
MTAPVQTSKSHRVLIVEDEGLIAADIARRLEMLGHRVTGIASTAQEASALAAEADVVLLDIHLDGPRDGIDAAMEIRARYQVPVIFLTAHADRTTLDRAKLAGPYGYLVKPLGPAALQAALEMAVYKHALSRQLEEQEAWLRTTLASVAEAVVVADAGGHVLLLNRTAETLTGWTQAEAKGRALDSVLPLLAAQGGSSVAGDLATLAMLRDDVVTDGRAVHLAARGGNTVEIEASVAPVKSCSGSLGVVVTLRDVGPRRWQENQLRQAQRMEAAGRLAASVVNDYSHLLGIIRNQGARLLAQFGEYSPARRAIEEIEQAATAADQITRRLASFGTRQAMHAEILSLNAVLRGLAKPIESVAGQRIAVTVHKTTGIGRIRADQEHLEQAIMNLVLHACAITPPGGALRLETGSSRNGHGRVSLTISYSGEEQDIDRLFDPSGEPETGLALAVAHAIVMEQEGHISASRAKQGGTQVEMLFPVAMEESGGAAAQPPSKTPTILLVDPREGVRMHLQNILEAGGYRLLEALSPEEAIALGELHEGSLDLLVADDEDAAVVTAALRANHPEMQELRVVQGPETALSELRRPFTERALVERIGALLTRAPERDAPDDVPDHLSNGAAAAISS